MSETIDARIVFEASYTLENVRMLLLALAGAVAENWRRYRDNWSDPEPKYPVDVDVWLDEMVPGHIESSAVRAWDCRRRHFDFPFSPVTWGDGTLYMGPGADASLSVLIAVPSQAQFEVRGSRERIRMELEWIQIRENRGEDPLSRLGPDWDDPEAEAWSDRYDDLLGTESVWPENRDCLRRIIGRLVEALPTREVTIPDVLREAEERGSGADP